MNKAINTTIKLEDGAPVLYVEGAVRSDNAGELEAAVDAALSEHPGAGLTLDFSGLNHISSAGLRVLFTARQRLDGGLVVRNVSAEVYDVFEITGFVELMEVRRRLREVDVTGCKVIGQGAYGKVYRLDEETIVKVYNTPDALAIIRNEQRLAKLAFLKGVPTAISYDAVRVGGNYGSVFELINAQTLNDQLVEAPQDADAIIRQYTEIIRKVHAVEVEPGVLPDCRETFAGYVDALGDILPAELAARLQAMFRAMPEDRHLVHGDFHMKNVMSCGGEPLLIDMDTLSVGDPVFDFAGIYAAYIAFNEDDPSNSEVFLSISRGMCDRIWDGVLAQCLRTPDAETRRAALDRILIAGSVRFLYIVVALGITIESLREVRIRHTLERLEALVPKVDELGVAGLCE